MGLGHDGTGTRRVWDMMELGHGGTGARWG